MVSLNLALGIKNNGNNLPTRVRDPFHAEDRGDLICSRPLGHGPEHKVLLRLVKGAYLEPPDIAYPKKEDVDRAYERLVEQKLSGGGFTAIATHDERLIERAIAYAEREHIGRECFQFQLLYGVRPRLQLDLAHRGFSVLVATPYGPDWYRYLMRRLAERPANLMFFARSVVRR